MTRKTFIIIIDIIGWALLVVYFGTETNFKLLPLTSVSLFALGVGTLIASLFKKEI